MEDKRCAICLKGNLSEDAPVLTISGYGIPRCLCDDCAKKIDIITRSRDIDEISSASLEITEDVTKYSIDDDIVYKAVTEQLEYASDRVKKIKNGTWDFALDEIEEPSELPEELLESEEDKLLDQKEKEQSKRLDKIMNWVYLGVILAAVAFAVYFLFLK